MFSLHSTTHTEASHMSSKLAGGMQERLSIVGRCDDQLDVFFRPLGMRLLKTANASVAWPTPERTLAIFKSLPSRQTAESTRPLVELLDYYAKNAGVELIDVQTSKDNMFEGEVQLEFACSPWRSLMKNELAISAEMLTSVHIVVDRLMIPIIKVHTAGLNGLELGQLRVVQAKLTSYWRDQLRWRRAHGARPTKAAMGTWEVYFHEMDFALALQNELGLHIDDPISVYFDIYQESPSVGMPALQLLDTEDVERYYDIFQRIWKPTLTWLQFRSSNDNLNG